MTPVILSLTMPFCPLRSSYDRRKMLPMDGSALTENYVRALRREIESAAADYDDCEVRVLKIGGGIAGHATDEELGCLLRDLRGWFHFSEDTQAVMNVYPGMISVETLNACRRGRIDWLSVDYATADPGESEALQRFLPPSAMETSMRVLEGSPLKLSFDVMLGLPGQSKGSLRRTLDTVTGFGAGRVALHKLELIPGTGLAEAAAEWARSSSSPRNHIPDEAECEELERWAAAYLLGTGFKPSRNRCFTRIEELFLLDKCAEERCAQIGFGLGAETRLDGIRAVTTLDMDTYLRYSADPERITACVKPDGSHSD